MSLGSVHGPRHVACADMPEDAQPYNKWCCLSCFSDEYSVRTLCGANLHHVIKRITS